MILTKKKLPSWAWLILWLLSLCTFSLYAKCSDEITIRFRGWPERIGEWWSKR